MNKIRSVNFARATRIYFSAANVNYCAVFLNALASQLQEVTKPGFVARAWNGIKRALGERAAVLKNLAAKFLEELETKDVELNVEEKANKYLITVNGTDNDHYHTPARLLIEFPKLANYDSALNIDKLLRVNVKAEYLYESKSVMPSDAKKAKAEFEKQPTQIFAESDAGAIHKIAELFSKVIFDKNKHTDFLAKFDISEDENVKDFLASNFED